MSKNISIFPRNFLRQPHVKEMVPDIKLTLLALMIECESAIGCWIPASIDDAVNIKHLSGAFEELERRGMISVDKKTGELFLTEFFRMNHFVGPKRVGQARTAFSVIRSERLRIEILEQISLNQRFCKLTPADLDEPDSAAPTPKKAPPKPPPVDNSDDSAKNQRVTLQGEGEVEVEVKVEVEVEEKAAASPPAADVYIETCFEQLMNRALKSGGKDYEQDRENIALLRGLSDWLGGQAVFNVIADCRYPTQAVKKARESGLFDQAASSKKKALSDSPRSAEVLEAARQANLRLVAMMRKAA